MRSPCPSRLKGRGVDVSKTLFYLSGDGGNKVRRTLEFYGMEYDGTVVNRKYWNKASKNICLEDLLEQVVEPVNLVIAFRGYQPEGLACYKDKINAVIDMDCWAGIDIASDKGVTYGWVKENAEDFQGLFDILQDGLSCSTLLAYLNQRISLGL